jgi:lipopolysaccharide export system protein LptA
MLWVVLVFCTLFSQVCNAATGAPPAAHGEEPPVVTIINSDHMLAENIENKIHFSGHVHLVKGHLKLTADTLDVFFVPPGKGGTLMENMQGKSGSQKIQTMVARGHVVILKDLRQAFAGKAVYIEASHLFVLTELPVVIENGDRISGERITFFTRINKSLVQGHGLMLLNGKGSRKKDSPTSPGKGAP